MCQWLSPREKDKKNCPMQRGHWDIMFPAWTMDPINIFKKHMYMSRVVLKWWVPPIKTGK